MSLFLRCRHLRFCQRSETLFLFSNRESLRGRRTALFVIIFIFNFFLFFKNKGHNVGGCKQAKNEDRAETSGELQTRRHQVSVRVQKVLGSNVWDGSFVFSGAERTAPHVRKTIRDKMQCTALFFLLRVRLFLLH